MHNEAEKQTKHMYNIGFDQQKLSEKNCKYLLTHQF